ncbi:HEAT repeat domain-containing protein [Bacillus sp. AK128]
MDNPIYLLVYVIVFLLLSLIILLLYLTIRKAVENRNRRMIDSYKEEYRDNMFRFLYKGERSRHLLPDSDFKYAALEELLNEFANVVEGEELEVRMEAFSEKYFLERFRKDLSHRRWSKRMNVLYNIESFRMKTMLNDVVSFYHSRKSLTEPEIVQVLKLMVKFDHPELFSTITNLKYPISEFVYRLLVSNMTESTFHYFVSKYDQLSNEMKLTIIDILGIENRHEFSGFLKQQLGSSHAEIRIRALKALANLSSPLSEEEMKQHLQSQNYEERIMALKICGSVRKKDYIPFIIERMSDTMFVVRQQAGAAIARYPNGIELLKGVLAQSTDQFARDMAIEWLEKGTNDAAIR